MPFGVKQQKQPANEMLWSFGLFFPALGSGRRCGLHAGGKGEELCMIVAGIGVTLQARIPCLCHQRHAVQTHCV